ncbi:unnamed protein product [Arctogadus glacialis]
MTTSRLEAIYLYASLTYPKVLPSSSHHPSTPPPGHGIKEESLYSRAPDSPPDTCQGAETMAVMLLCLVHVLSERQLRSHPLLPAGPTSWGRASKCSQHCPLLRPRGRSRQGRAGQGAAGAVVVVATEQRD